MLTHTRLSHARLTDLETLVGRRTDKIYMAVPKVQRHSSKRGHGIHMVLGPSRMSDHADLGHRVEQTCGSLAVHHRHIGNGAALVGQRPPHSLGIHWSVLRADQPHGLNPQALGNVSQSPSIGAVDRDKQLPPPGHRRANHRFVPKRPASLKDDGLISLIAVRGDVRDDKQAAVDVLDDLKELSVPGSHVHLHDRLDSGADGEGSRSEEKLLSASWNGDDGARGGWDRTWCHIGPIGPWTAAGRSGSPVLDMIQEYGSVALQVRYLNNIDVEFL